MDYQTCQEIVALLQDQMRRVNQFRESLKTFGELWADLRDQQVRISELQSKEEEAEQVEDHQDRLAAVADPRPLLPLPALIYVPERHPEVEVASPKPQVASQDHTLTHKGNLSSPISAAFGEDTEADTSDFVLDVVLKRPPAKPPNGFHSCSILVLETCRMFSFSSTHLLIVDVVDEVCNLFRTGCDEAGISNQSLQPAVDSSQTDLLTSCLGATAILYETADDRAPIATDLLFNLSISVLAMFNKGEHKPTRGIYSNVWGRGVLASYKGQRGVAVLGLNNPQCVPDSAPLTHGLLVSNFYFDNHLEIDSAMLFLLLSLNILPDVIMFLRSSLIGLGERCGDLFGACTVFDTIPERGVVFDQLVSCLDGHGEACLLSMFFCQPVSVLVDNSIVQFLMGLEWYRVLLCLSVVTGRDQNIMVGTSLSAGYEIYAMFFDVRGFVDELELGLKCEVDLVDQTLEILIEERPSAKPPDGFALLLLVVVLSGADQGSYTTLEQLSLSSNYQLNLSSLFEFDFFRPPAKPPEDCTGIYLGLFGANCTIVSSSFLDEDQIVSGKLLGGISKLKSLRLFDASTNLLEGGIPEEPFRLPIESLHLYEIGIIQLECPVIDKQLAAEEISVQILRKLRDDASKFSIGQVFKVVFTVAAYFIGFQRIATKDADRIASLEDLRLLNDATAALLTYEFEKKSNYAILVFDMGGGTFNVSVLEVMDGVVVVLSTSGATHFDGADLGKKIINWPAQDFRTYVGIDLLKDNQVLQAIMRYLVLLIKFYFCLPFLIALHDGVAEVCDVSLIKFKGVLPNHFRSVWSWAQLELQKANFSQHGNLSLEFIQNSYGGFIVCSSADGPMLRSEEHILKTKQVGVPYMVAFLHEQDQVEDEGLLQLVELVIRDLVPSDEYRFDEEPIISSLALLAFEALTANSMSDQCENNWFNKIHQLMVVANEYIPIPQSQIELLFLQGAKEAAELFGYLLLIEDNRLVSKRCGNVGASGVSSNLYSVLHSMEHDLSEEENIFCWIAIIDRILAHECAVESLGLRAKMVKDDIFGKRATSMRKVKRILRVFLWFSQSRPPEEGSWSCLNDIMSMMIHGLNLEDKVDFKGERVDTTEESMGQEHDNIMGQEWAIVDPSNCKIEDRMKSINSVLRT